MSDSKLAEQSRKLAACQRVMDLIDAYVERPNAGNRLSIREALLELADHEKQAEQPPPLYTAPKLRALIDRAAAQQAGEAVARVRVTSVTPGRFDELDVLRPLPQGEHLLYTRPLQPLTEEQIAVLKFLDGSGLLRGAGYGSLPEGERRPFWWRKQLGDAFPQIRAHGITKDTK